MVTINTVQKILKISLVISYTFHNIDVVVRNCRAEANKQRHTSISFPALGTGFLKYQPRTVIASMFNTVEDFAKLNLNSTVRIVNCVILSWDNDTIKVHNIFCPLIIIYFVIIVFILYYWHD